jgi:hypothetical protein
MTPEAIIRASRVLSREEAVAFVRADARRHSGRPADLVQVSREQLQILTTDDFRITDLGVPVSVVSSYECPTLQLIRTP